MEILVEGAVFNVTGANGFNRDVEVTKWKNYTRKIKKAVI